MLAHQHLLGLVASALQAPPAAAALITRQRTRALASDVTASIGVRVISSRSQALVLGGNAPIDWETVIGVECMARTGASMAADEAVGPVLMAAHARLMSSAAAFEAVGYQLQTDLQIEWDQEELDDRIGSATVICTFHHRQAFDTLAA